MPRTSIRHQYSAGRSENYLASVSDLMSALLFVFIIALACAIIQAQSAANEAEAAQTRAEDAQTRAEEAQAQATTAHAQAEQVRERLVEVEKRLQGNNVARAGLLMHIKERLAADLGIQVSIDTSKGVLRLAEEAVTFRKQSYALESPYLERVSEMGSISPKFSPATARQVWTIQRVRRLCAKRSIQTAIFLMPSSLKVTRTICASVATQATGAIACFLLHEQTQSLRLWCSAMQNLLK